MKQQLNKLGSGIVKAAALASLGALMTMGVGCDNSGDVYSPAWYNVYGQYCGSVPGPGCDYYANGVKIYISDDPYYAALTQTYGSWNYTDAYGVAWNYTGYGTLSPSGILYDSNNYPLNSTGGRSDKDTLGAAEESEADTLAAVSTDFQAKHPMMTVERANDLVKNLHQWATLTKNRSRTSSDVDHFAQKLFGISAAKAGRALLAVKEGDASLMKEATDDVAGNWGMSPEETDGLLREFYGMKR